MTAIPLRQRSSTEIVDAAFQVYRREATQFVLATAIIYVPWLFVQMALGVNANGAPMAPAATLVFLIGSIVVSALVGGVTTIIASDVYLGNASDITRAYRTVVGHLGSLIVAQLLATMVIVFGMLFFLIPGLYALARFFAVGQVILLEQKGVGAAFSRSALLSDGNKRHILNALLLAGLLLGALLLGTRLLSGQLPNALSLTVTTIISAILYPFFGITQTLLYYDTRIRKEGFDVEYLASEASLGKAATVPAPSA